MSNEGDIYTIEKIIKHRVDKKRGKLYYIKWQGWNDKHNTWEPEENILDKDLLEKYAESKKKDSKRLSGQPPTKKTKYDSDQESVNANNSALSVTSEAQSEGHFDAEDADKDVAETNIEETADVDKPGNAENKESTPENIEKPSVVDELENDLNSETTVAVEIETEQQQLEKDSEKQDKKEEASIDFFAKEVSDSEYQITKQNDPECEVKIQLTGEPCVTLQNNNDEPSESASNDIPFEKSEEKDPVELNTASAPLEQ